MILGNCIWLYLCTLCVWKGYKPKMQEFDHRQKLWFYGSKTCTKLQQSRFLTSARFHLNHVKLLIDLTGLLGSSCECLECSIIDEHKQMKLYSLTRGNTLIISCLDLPLYVKIQMK